MKNLIKILLTLFLFANILSPVYSFNIYHDSIEEARFALPPKDTTGYPLNFIGGLGMTTGSTNYPWYSDFYSGPALAFGLEIPFTRAERFSIEFLNHTWISKSKRNLEINGHNNDYIKISDNIYFLGGFSAVIRYYFAKKESKIRFSLHLGQLLFGYKGWRKGYDGLEVGCGLNYKINDIWNINLLDKIILLGHWDIAGYSDVITPNMILLNLQYKLIIK